eukprot:8148191-Pyramimonas_sp.AAC.1
MQGPAHCATCHSEVSRARLTPRALRFVMHERCNDADVLQSARRQRRFIGQRESAPILRPTRCRAIMIG